MKKWLVLIVFSLIYGLACRNTEMPIDTRMPCTRVFDTTTTLENYIETDSLSPFKGKVTLNLTLRTIRIARQTGDCNIVLLCDNFMTVGNRTEKTITIFYNTVGGANVTIRPYETKYDVVPPNAISSVTGSCFNFMEYKNSVKVRYY